MHCVNCGTALIPGKQFCHACGTRVARTCTHCGSAIDPGFRFCPECGTPVEGEDVPPAAAAARAALRARDVPAALAAKIRAAQGLSAGERKLVTVLFADLVGSTALAGGLDPEEYRDLLEQYMEIAFREIYQVEGIVNQLAGDGVMALFGAPIAHEDAPYRAVYAALAMRDALGALSTRLRAERGLDLRLRIGIHTGPVVVGTVGNDLKMDYTAIGDTTNLAARLQTAAAPGTILASEATHRLVRGLFEFAAARRFEVKGKSEPITAYEVLALRESTGPMAIAEARGLTPLVGRSEELAQLAACFDRIDGRLGQVVAIVGEAGSGKSRLLYEFKDRIAGRPVAFFEARCAAMTQAVPYAPWNAMLRHYFGLRPDDDTATACAKVKEKIGAISADLASTHPLLCQVLSLPGYGNDEVPEEEVKRQTFEAVATLVMHAAEREPVVMIIEDLHWIDDASHEMLQLAMGRIKRSRLMLLVSHRPEYQPSWRTGAVFTQLTLAPLAEEETIAIIRAVAEGALPPDLERRILQTAEGNPFFTEEITRALVEEGYLLRADGHVRLTRPVAEMRLPGTVEELIGARLDRLGAAGKRVVQVASVLGRQFHREQLRLLLAPEGIDVAQELATLEQRGIVHRKTLLSDDELRFGESLTQQVAYESLLLRQRRELHERIGDLLDAAPGEMTAERSALLAHHYGRSENRLKAITALLRAARDAERLPSFRVAAQYYDDAWSRAAEALDVSPDDASLQRLGLEAAYGVSRMSVIYGLAMTAEVTAAAERGRALATRLGDDETLANLCALLGMLRTANGPDAFEEGNALIEEGLAIAERGGYRLTATRISRALAWAYVFDGRLAEARERLDWVLAELARLGDPKRNADLQLGALFMRDRMRFFADDLAGAAAGAATTYDAAARAPNRTVESGSAATLALVHYMRAEYAAAREWAERCLERADQIGTLWQCLAMAAIDVGARRELGEPLPPARYLDVLEHGLARGPDFMNCRQIVEVLLAAGDAREAERYATAAYGRSGGRLAASTCAVAIGDVLLHLGPTRHAEAQAWYDRAHAVAHALGARSVAASATLGLARLAALRGERDAAVRQAEEARTAYVALDFVRDAGQAEALLTEIEGEGAQQSA